MSDETRTERAGGADAFVMLLSAAIFGYFGFYLQWTTHTAAGVLVPAWVALIWTLKGACVGFGLSAAIAFAGQSKAANLLYAVTSILSAVAFLVVLGMDYFDAHPPVALSWFLLLVFAAWNGYGGWMGLRPFIRQA